MDTQLSTSLSSLLSAFQNNDFDKVPSAIKIIIQTCSWLDYKCFLGFVPYEATLENVIPLLVSNLDNPEIFSTPEQTTDVFSLIKRLGYHDSIKLLFLRSGILEKLLQKVNISHPSTLEDNGNLQRIELVQELIVDIKIEEICVEVKVFISLALDIICRNQAVSSPFMGLLAQLSLNPLMLNYICDSVLVNDNDRRKLFRGIVSMLGEKKDRYLRLYSLLFLFEFSSKIGSQEKFFNEKNVKNACELVFLVLSSSKTTLLISNAASLFCAMLSYDRIKTMCERNVNFDKLFDSLMLSINETCHENLVLTSKILIMTINTSNVFEERITATVESYKENINKYLGMSLKYWRASDCGASIDIYRFILFLCRCNTHINEESFLAIKGKCVSDFSKLDISRIKTWTNTQKIFSVNAICLLHLLPEQLKDQQVQDIINHQCMIPIFIWSLDCEQRLDNESVSKTLSDRLKLEKDSLVLDDIKEFRNLSENIIEHEGKVSSYSQASEELSDIAFHSVNQKKSLQSLLDKMKEKHAKAANKENILTQRFENENNRFKNIEKQHEGLTRDHLRALSQKTKREGEVQNLKEQLENFTAKYEKKSAKFSQLRHELAEQMHFSKQLEDNVHEYESLVSDVTNKNEFLQTQLSNEEKENSQMKDALTSLNLQIPFLKEEISKMTTEIEKANDQKDIYQQKSQILLEEKKNDELEWHKESQSNQNKMAKLNEEILLQRNLIESWKNEIQVMTHAKETLHSRFLEVNLANENLQHQMYCQQSIVSSLSMNLSETQDELQATKHDCLSRVHEKDTEIKSLKGKFLKSEKNWTEKNQSLAQSLSQRNIQNQKLDESLKKIKTLLADSQHTCEERQTQLETKTKDYIALQKEKDAECASKEVETMQLLKEIEDMKIQFANLQETLNQKDTIIETKQRKIERSNGEIGNLKETLKRVEHEKQEVSDELDKYTNLLDKLTSK